MVLGEVEAGSVWLRIEVDCKVDRLGDFWERDEDDSRMAELVAELMAELVDVEKLMDELAEGLLGEACVVVLAMALTV